MSTIEETQMQTTDATDYQRDELHTALHERLVQTGEWHRIMASLRASLDESGWSASLREQAQSQAAQQQNLSLPDLIEELTPFAEKTIPLQVREQITAVLHDFVARNVEDA
ncbi:uncharacterized protein FA14DRAFT_159460 [Meira miltonrushii]|uniref:Transcription and mRNA export factor SUS1 n=1 Tax=Meira miltonrushii TaxID=1280837 RepID=A0A316VI98_9BASI|nr:uncharacterized protein FA14DRAFT_159460 [Meira miltonrushii]PWN37387.1 hypothetical protein FA14DRAFT_159460 [Meira miltonrushii]